MEAFRLPDQTHIGNVHLKVIDISKALDFYSSLLGFHLTGRSENTIHLSSAPEKPPVIILTGEPDASQRPSNTTGLYHMAIRMPDRLELARIFKRLIDIRYPLGGISDHLVSEAIYLSDPEGNGIEIYRDRPRSKWSHEGGAVSMATKRLSPEGLLAELKNEDRAWDGINRETDMGHVHLQVSDLTRSEEFYHGLLGLDVTVRSYPGALFLSAGGYHHHIGLNTWESLEAPPPPTNATGLISYSIVVPDEGVWRSLKDRLTEAGANPEETGKLSLLVRDPDSIGVEITV